MKKVIVIYDDSKMPGADIKSITGNKSYGNTIFKRVTLAEHTARLLGGIEAVAGFTTPERSAAYLALPENSGASILLLYSQFIISDNAAFEVLVKKAIYAHRNYKTVTNDKISSVIFPNEGAFASASAKDYQSFDVIEGNPFTDISDINNFRQFITSGFEARFFNAVSGDEYTVVKRSENKDKIKKEYEFYGLLPDSMKQWFVRPFDYEEGKDYASYKMERYHMADLAIRYVHGAISMDEFDDILEKLFFFSKNRVTKKVTKEEYENIATSLYITKVEDRIEQLKQSKEFTRLNSLINDFTGYTGIDEIVEDYKSVYNILRKNKRFKYVSTVAHGDMCFSNILYSNEISMLKLIDPKGALNEEEIYMDPYYDLAKLSHSVCGYYDFFNSNLYEITFDESLKAHLTIDFDNSEYVKLFKTRLEENGIDFRLIRLYECSLFLSMLPLHIDRPKKVFAFVLNAIAILSSLKETK